MDAPRPEPMTEADLDREIAAALSVEPSPAFVARVRQRIAVEPAASPWYLWRSTWAAAAVAAAIVMAVLLRIEHDSRPLGVARAPSIESRPSAGIGELERERHSRRSWPNSLRRPSIVAAAAPVVRPEPDTALQPASSAGGPEILIDAREARALRALFAGAALGRVDLTPLISAAAKATSELTPPGDIVVAPLVNEPLTPVSGEGARP